MLFWGWIFSLLAGTWLCMDGRVGQLFGTGTASVKLHRIKWPQQKFRLFLSAFSSTVSIKRCVALVRFEITWWEDFQAAWLIKFEGVCLGTDSVWSFSRVWIWINRLSVHGAKLIVSESRNILAHYQVLNYTAFIFCVSSGIGALSSGFEMTLDVLACVWVCVCLFVCFLLLHGLHN